jgi:uncharacterized protein (DUF2147 family)
MPLSGPISSATDTSNPNLLKMIKTLFLLLLTGLVYTHSYAQNQSNVIIGKWLKLPKKDLIIEVYKTATAYHGKICWTKPGDDKPVGFVIIENLKYNSESNKWEHGIIQDPNSSMSYSAEVKLDDERNLIVKGYKGLKFISTSRTFMRVKS